MQGPMDALGPSRKRPKPDPFNQNGTSALGGAGYSDCRRYYTPEGCPFGDSCRFGHPNSAGNGTGKESAFGGGMSKSKPCMKFFSTSGCPYGEGCHFSHYLPGGLPALALSGFGAVGAGKLLGGLGIASLAVSSLLTMDPGANLGEYKSRLCNRYDTAEGCRFGSSCHFAHGEEELHKLVSDLDGFPSLELSASGSQAVSAGLYEAEANVSGLPESAGCSTGALPYREPTPPGMAAAASFGASSKAKISIDANLAGAIIGKSGMNAKQICRLTGAKLSIRGHESDPNLRNVEMEGSFEQIKLASQMVRELLMHKDSLPPKPSWFGSHNYKTKICQNFCKGTCTFGDRCHFAHGDTEMREPSVQA